MPSILPGYEYDIFISYRHNDNLDGWVTNFVESLEKELRGTLKEPLSIYFEHQPPRWTFRKSQCGQEPRRETEMSHLHPDHISNLLRPQILCLAT